MSLKYQKPFPTPDSGTTFGDCDAKTLAQNVKIFNQNMDLISEMLSGISNSYFSVALPAGNYNIQNSDYFIGSIAMNSPVIIRLPPADLIGYTCNIKMLGTQKVTIVPDGFDTIDGFSYPIIINKRFTSYSFINYNIGEWAII